MKKVLLLMFAMAFALCYSACGYKSQVSELNAQIYGLQERLEESEKTIQELQTQLAESNQTVQTLKKQLESAEKNETKQNPVHETPDNITGDTKDPNESESKLGTVETEIFELLTDALYSFDNPASVRVIKFHAYSEKEKTYYLTITSENFLGGHLTDLYKLSADGAYGTTYTEKQLSNMWTILDLRSPSCDISQINHALEQYCQDKGLYPTTGLSINSLCFIPSP